MSKYHKDVSHIKTLDPYRLQELYQMHPCAEHVVKKLLVAGERSGGKTLDQDIADCVWTLQRWQEMRAEDAQRVDATCEADVVGGGFAAAHGVDVASRYGGILIPSEAEWIATDPDGAIYAFGHKPRPVNGEWWTKGGPVELVGRREPDANWVNSLEPAR